MAIVSQLQLRRGTATEVAAFTGAVGEVTPDTTNNRLVLHDGTTAGGHPHATEQYVDDAIASISGAGGDVVGPASATDAAVVGFDGATGKLIKELTETEVQAAAGATTVGAAVLTAADALTAWLAVAPSGSVIGSAYGTYKSNAALSANIPVDDSIPQSNEGTEIISLVYTPRVSTSSLRISFRGQVSANNQQNVVGAIFNGGANALSATVINIPASDTKYVMTIDSQYSPGVITPQTISVRCGANSGNMYLNGHSISRLMGGASTAILEVLEII